ncbi:MAG: wax ester/triacylglycerol synthase family O-acyltransferase [Nocardioides sp.]|uniref:wax ester/triacylglycerol synthase family O-acyltransferase n=1 Tax=Nocardioides sp. TaxID=35761 RepID=UPI003F0A45B6
MHRLSGTDSGFLAMEHPWQPMYNVALGVLAPAQDGAPVTREALRDHLAGRLDQLPAFRQRVVEVPGGWHHPVAVDDPDLDLDRHVLELSAAECAERGATLDEVVASLAEEPMDADRPLWRVWLVHPPHAGFAGVEDGGAAVVLHFHHAIADGTAAMAIFRRVFSDAAQPPVAGAEPYRPRPVPSAARLRWSAFARHLVGLLRLVAAVVGAVRGLRRVRARKEVADVEVPPISEGAPRTELNDAFTPQRACVRVQLQMEGLKRIRVHTSATLNDVLLGVVAGALRRYLAGRDGVPELPLLCNMPVSEEPADAPERTSGNNFWSLTTTLATDVEDPLERLARIKEVTGECKTQLAAFGVSTVPALLDVVPPRLLARGTRRVSERLREATEVVDASVLVSNVRGSAAPFSLLGHEVESLWVCGPPSNGIGCNVSAMSYGDHMNAMVLAYADALDDPEALAAAFVDSYLELLALTEAEQAASA